MSPIYLSIFSIPLSPSVVCFGPSRSDSRSLLQSQYVLIYDRSPGHHCQQTNEQGGKRTIYIYRYLNMNEQGEPWIQPPSTSHRKQITHYRHDLYHTLEVCHSEALLSIATRSTIGARISSILRNIMSRDALCCS